MAIRRFLACVVALVLCFLPLWTAAGELTSLDIGGAEPGSTKRAGDGYEITGGGKDIWDESDAFRFVFQRVSGDCEVRALVVSQQNTHLWAKSGVMVRQSTAPGAIHAMLVTSPQPRVAFERRAGTDGMSKSSICMTDPLPQWLRLVRSKQSIVAYVAADKAGTDWRPVGTQYLELTDPVLIGLCVTSHEPGKLSTAVFQHVAVVSLPAGAEADPNRTSAEVAESEAKPKDMKLAAALAASAAKLSSEGKAEKSRQLCFAALVQDEDCAEALYELAKAFEQDGKTITAGDFLFRADRKSVV
jgi:hypothetical protein